MADTIEYLAGALVQHGQSNDRIYVMDPGTAEPRPLRDALDALAHKRGYGKIFAKLPARFRHDFLHEGYRVEAEIPSMYSGKEDGLFLGRFLKEEREQESREIREKRLNVLATANSRTPLDSPPDLPQGLRLSRPTPDQAEEMAVVYREVFPSYPFPIHDPAYLRRTMEEDVLYFGLWEGDKLIALSSCEMNRNHHFAEMTDFATLPNYRGKGIASCLLAVMEPAARDEGILTAYTIARAPSFGMNITFAKLGYEFSGSLINNTNISGGFETMNVWWKKLR